MPHLKPTAFTLRIGFFQLGNEIIRVCELGYLRFRTVV
jgi:hypothetical protein